MRDVLDSESGFSLIELLVAMVILGIGVVAVVSALGTSIVSSGTHRSFSTAETVTRDFAEAVNIKANSTNPYNVCPTAAQLTPSFTSPMRGSTALYVVTIEAPPSKWSADDPTADAVQYWIPTTFPNGSFQTRTACFQFSADGPPGFVQNNCNPTDYGYDGSNPSTYKPKASCDPGLERVWVHVRSNASALAKGVSDSEYVDQYSRILVRRNDSQAP